VNIAGVILNKTGGARHEGKLRAAVETYTDLPVLGAVSRAGELDIGERHLGLTTPAETGALTQMIDGFGQIIGESVDLERLEVIAKSAPALTVDVAKTLEQHRTTMRIGIVQDQAFGFYYPDDLEAFARAGATLVAVNSLTDTALPDIDGLFIGGGFPETQMHALAANRSLRMSIKTAIENGLPTYAECGGLMYLCRSLSWQGESAEMVGVVPADAVMHARPQGRGYTRYRATSAHPWGAQSDELRAHEFHYAGLENLPETMVYARHMSRGAGISGARDGVVIHNLLAGFCHLRNSAANPWVDRFVAFVRQNLQK
jgi:cobyrinic acid a,c-diamide synthase